MARMQHIPPLENQISLMRGNVVALASKKLPSGSESYLLISEREATCKYGGCVFFGDGTVDCNWLKDIRCDRKCLGRVSDYKSIGVDSGKIKYRITRDEISLGRHIRKFLKVADKVEMKEREKERKRVIARRKIKLMKILDEIEKEKISESDIIGVPRYNIKSLI